MKLTKTIENLIETMDISDLWPWQRGEEPVKKWAIQEGQELPKIKECIFCGEEVPLMWEPNADVKVKDPDFVSGLGDGLSPTVYRVARDIHPKCSKLRKLFNKWGVVEKKAFETDNFVICDENKNAYSTVTEWINEPKSTGLYLFGGTGTGKTLLTTKIILESSEQSKQIISESDLYENLKPNLYDEDSQENIDDFVRSVRNTRLLVIDDIGTCKKSEWKMEMLYSVISKRIDWGLPTFFTSNCTPTELYDKIDGKIVSRIFELTNPCHVGGIDHRFIR